MDAVAVLAVDVDPVFERYLVLADVICIFIRLRFRDLGVGGSA
jgi:hypothetical protein